VLLMAASSVGLAQTPSESTIPVSVESFPRAESNLYMSRTVNEGGFGKFVHNRTLTEIDKQTVVRMNRDTLYSAAVFDLDASPVTITLPNAGKRFMSMQVISEDHYVPLVAYGPKPITLTREMVGARYAMIAVRTLVNPSDPQDLAAVHNLQDGIAVRQKDVGTFEVPPWDEAEQKTIRDALLVLASATEGFSHAFGAKGRVDPIRHLIATAAGWGGNPDRDATHLSFTPAQNDGTTVYKLKVRNVPVSAFWSVSVYNSEGYFEKNPYDAYSLNDITANKDPDGSVTVQFGDCDGRIPNCLPTMRGWNYTVRLYRPRAEILDGQWKFPEAQAIEFTSRALQ
jgi:hypothetical protein